MPSSRQSLMQHGEVTHSVVHEAVEVRIESSDLAVDRAEVESSLGYPGGKMPAHLRPGLEEVLAAYRTHLVVRAGYRIVETRRDPSRPEGMYAGGTFFHMRTLVTGLLKKSEHLAFFVCTIGPGMESWRNRLQADGDLVAAFLVDTVASLAVESAVNLLHDRIEVSMRAQGLKITNRYSPGYCDWSVAEQHLLFSLFPPGFCGITLLDSSLMVPIKSVSGVIGIGKRVKRAQYTCDACGMKDCTYRSTRTRSSTPSTKRKIQP